MDETSQPDIPIRMSKAYHEAGHAVAALLVGGSVDWIEVAPKPHTMARVDPEFQAIVLAGGVAAEALVTGGWSFGGGMDEDELRGLGLSDKQVNDLVGNVARMLHAAWPVVDLLATRLGEVDEMDGSEFRVVVALALLTLEVRP